MSPSQNPQSSSAVSAGAIALSGLDSAEALEQKLIALFKQADTDSSGVLDLVEFATLVRSADLGLQESELTDMLLDADTNDDGDIEYSEFVRALTLKVSKALSLGAFERASCSERTRPASPTIAARVASSYHTLCFHTQPQVSPHTSHPHLPPTNPHTPPLLS